MLVLLLTNGNVNQQSIYSSFKVFYSLKTVLRTSFCHMQGKISTLLLPLYVMYYSRFSKRSDDDEDSRNRRISTKCCYFSLLNKQLTTGFQTM